ncbi:MAG TPA: hypothetical protein VH988_01350 [Thermoanaerobaculia bacterium]|jgi:hypothetical protein|nr:hypothetical protein [Thermoanaerobaculia bacterium]
MVQRQMSFPVLAAAALALCALPAAAQNQHDMTFHTVPPCYVANTFNAGGAFAPNETRTYNVVGSGSFASQGGSATGCGIPGFSNGIARVEAVALNVLVVNPTGAGHIWAVAADTAINALTTPTFMNFPAPAGQCCISLSNTGPLAVAQASGVGDIKINVAVSSAHVVVSVVGYYTRFGETILVGPGATPAASGTALLNALTSIADNAASKPYLIKIEPGIYDLGTTTLNMKSYVDLEGSGQQATIIQGAGAADFSIAVVNAAASSELRDLQVKSTGGSSDGVAVPLLITTTNTNVRRVTVTASGPSTCSLWGIRLVNMTGEINDVTANLSGGNLGQGITSKGFGTPKIHRAHITVTNSASTAYGFLATDGGAFPEIEDTRVEVNGGPTAYGFWQDGSAYTAGEIRGSTFIVSTPSGTATAVRFQGSSLRISRSTLRASGSTSYGINLSNNVLVDNSEIAGATATVAGSGASIGGSKLDGGPASGATCAGVWDENYTFSASTCP